MNEVETKTSHKSFWTLHQHAKLFSTIAFCSSFLLIAINRDGSIQGRLAAEPPSSQEVSNDSNKIQQEDDKAREKKELICWIKKHNVIDNRFFKTNLEQTKPLEWDEKFEKNIYRLSIASLWDEKIRDENLRYLLKCSDIFLIALNTDTTKLSPKGLRQLKADKATIFLFIYSEQTMMGTVTDRAWGIKAEAMPIIQQYFQATGGGKAPL